MFRKCKLVKVAIKSPHFINQPLVLCFIVEVCMYIAKVVVFFSFSSFFFAYLLAPQAAYGQNFQSLYLWLCYCQSCRIMNVSSLGTEVSKEEIMVFPIVCKIFHRSIFFKFDSFFVDPMGNLGYINISRSLTRFWPVVCLGSGKLCYIWSTYQGCRKRGGWGG